MPFSSRRARQKRQTRPPLLWYYFDTQMPDTVEKSGGTLKDRTIVYALGIYINPGMRNLLLEYLKRASPRYKAVHVMFCYWWPGIDREPFVGMVNSLGIGNLKAWEFSIMASPSYGRRLGWRGASW